MFVLDWTAYPFITLAVALPMAVFWLIEHRKEVQADREYDGPCMAHTGTDRDGTELWCWQKAGHSGAHDDAGAYEELTSRLRAAARDQCFRSSNCVLRNGHSDPCQLEYSDDDPDVLDISTHAVTRSLLAHIPTQGVCGIELGIDSRCVWAPGHLGECSDF